MHEQFLFFYMVAMTTSVAAATTITPGTTEPGKLTNISLPIVAGMIIETNAM